MVAQGVCSGLVNLLAHSDRDCVRVAAVRGALYHRYNEWLIMVVAMVLSSFLSLMT
jgi:hypothetical protein